MDELVAELARRLEAARCLPQPTRTRVLDWARDLADPHLVRGYLDNFLPMVELIAREGGPAFVRLCDELYDEDYEWRVLRRFDGSGEYDFEGWGALETRQLSDAEQVFCTANKWALMLPPDADGLARVVSGTRFVQLAFRSEREGTAAAIRWAEEELGITPASYANPAVICAVTRPLVENERGINAVQFLAQLAARLSGFGRPGDAAGLLAGMLWSEANGPLTAANASERLNRLRGYYEAFIPDEPASDLSAELVERFPELRELILSSIAVACGQYAEALARADRQTDEPARALTVLAAFLGLWPASGASFERVHRLRTQLPPDMLRRVLGLWAECLCAADRMDETAGALLVLFIDPERSQPAVAFPAVWQSAEAEAAAAVLNAVAMALGEDERAGQALGLMCAALGMREADFADPDRAAHALVDRFAALQGPTVLRLAGGLMLHLWSCGRPLDALATIEGVLGLGTEEYAHSPAVREHLRPYWSGEVPDAVEASYLLRMSILLHLSDRTRHALRLLRAINPELSRSWEVGAYERLRGWLSDLPASTIDEFISRLGLLWRGVEPVATVELLTAHLHLDAGALADRERLRAALHRRRRQMPLTAWSLAASGLVWGKVCVASWEPDPAATLGQAIAIGEAALGIDPAWYAADVPLALPEGLEGAPPALWGMLTSDISTGLTAALVAGNRPGDAVAIIDRYFRFAFGASYRDPGFLARLVAGGDSGADRGVAFQCLASLVAALQRAGRDEELCRLVAELVRSEDWFTPGRQAYTGLSWHVIDTVLPVLAEHDPPAALRLARAFVPAFRTFGLREDVTGIDRVELIRFTRDVRHHLIQTGYDAVSAAPDGGARLRVETLCWDAELGQLMLRERFDRQQPRPEVEPAPLPAEFPFPPAVEPEAGPAVALRAMEHATAGPPPIRLDGPGSTTECDGTTPEALVDALDADERLLRIGFATDGRLVWTLFAADKERRTLRIVCDERSDQASAPPHRPRVAPAVRAYEAAMAAATAAYAARTAKLDARLVQDGDDATRADVERERQRAETAYRTEQNTAVEQLFRAPVDARALVIDAVRAHDDAIATAWAEYVRQDRELHDQFDRDMRRFVLPHMAAKLRPALERQLDDRRAGALTAHRAALDAATDRFLTTISAAVPLDTLTELLSEEHDLVVQVDDVLHAIPFGFLTAGGRYLFEQVRSMRATLSLSIDDELGHLDARAVNPTWFAGAHEAQAEQPPRVVGLSWFNPADTARPWARVFHRALAAVAGEPGCGGPEYRAAGEDPAGSHAALAADLATGGAVRVLAVLGHGSAERAGVELADGFWTGAELLPPPPTESTTGCDLSAVEFLIQVSCSVGRVRQTGVRDVDGFCANLVVGRVRAAAAGLWDLFAEDAVAFAADLTRRYLIARVALDDDLAQLGFASFKLHRPRARALAAARRAWRDTNSGPTPRGLNTVAAFELYGRG